MSRRTPFEMVAEFHEVFGVSKRDTPTTALPWGERILRDTLMAEEVKELAEAVRDEDLVEIADALADIVYIACGTAHAYGIDLDDVFEEVHRSNMTKLHTDARGQKRVVKRDDGKVLKPDTFEEPRIEEVLRRLGWSGSNP